MLKLTLINISISWIYRILSFHFTACLQDMMARSSNFGLRKWSGIVPLFVRYYLAVSACISENRGLIRWAVIMLSSRLWSIIHHIKNLKLAFWLVEIVWKIYSQRGHKMGTEKKWWQMKQILIRQLKFDQCDPGLYCWNRSCLKTLDVFFSLHTAQHQVATVKSP